MARRSFLVHQLHNPSGWAGSLAGWIMATRPSNRLRNRWTVDLLAVAPGMDVLELGCGPGLALKDLLARGARVTGADHSPVMLAQAARRNRATLAAGRLVLEQVELEDWRPPAAAFDRICSANVLQFLANRQQVVTRLIEALKPGGRIATTFQPRGAKPSAEKANAFATEMSQALRHAGAVDIEIRELALKPVPAVCVLAARPGVLNAS